MERTREMKIAFVIPGVAGGGVRSVVRIATGLSLRGHDLRILYRTQSKSLRDIARSVYLTLRYGKKPQWLSNFPGQTQSYQTITPEVVGENDVVIGVGVSCVLEIADLPDACGLKIHNSRGVEPWIEENMRRAWKISMPRIIVGSHLKPLMREMGSDDPIYLAHNGIDTKEYYPSLPPDQRDGVGTVYHGGDVKDPNLILATMNNLHRERPDVPLYLFGTFPRPQALPVKAVYVRYPSLKQARDLYSRSKVWFIASRNEGLPNPLMEAMSCGAAAVSTDCGGPSDIITTGKNGFIVPVSDTQAMTDAILKLLDDPTLRKEMVDQSNVILRQFTWDNAVVQMEKAIIAIVDHQRKPHAQAEEANSLSAGTISSSKN